MMHLGFLSSLKCDKGIAKRHSRSWKTRWPRTPSARARAHESHSAHFLPFALRLAQWSDLEDRIKSGSGQGWLNPRDGIWKKTSLGHPELSMNSLEKTWLVFLKLRGNLEDRAPWTGSFWFCLSSLFPNLHDVSNSQEVSGPLAQEVSLPVPKQNHETRLDPLIHQFIYGISLPLYLITYRSSPRPPDRRSACISGALAGGWLGMTNDRLFSL